MSLQEVLDPLQERLDVNSFEMLGRCSKFLRQSLCLNNYNLKTESFMYIVRSLTFYINSGGGLINDMVNCINEEFLNFHVLAFRLWKLNLIQSHYIGSGFMVMLLQSRDGSPILVSICKSAMFYYVFRMVKLRSLFERIEEGTANLQVLNSWKILTLHRSMFHPTVFIPILKTLIYRNFNVISGSTHLKGRPQNMFGQFILPQGTVVCRYRRKRVLVEMWPCIINDIFD